MKEPHSSIQGNREEADQEVGILGRRRAPPGWAGDLVC